MPKWSGKFGAILEQNSGKIRAEKKKRGCLFCALSDLNLFLDFIISWDSETLRWTLLIQHLVLESCPLSLMIRWRDANLVARIVTSLITCNDIAGQTKARVWIASFLKSWFSGRGWGQQLFSFQSPAVQWIARTSSLNCLSCRNPYQTPHSLNCLPPFHWNPLFFTEKCFVASPSQNRLWFLWERKKTHKEKIKHKQPFPGILGGILFVCFVSPTRNDQKKTPKQIFGTHPVPGQSRKFIYVYVLFLSLILQESRKRGPQKRGPQKRCPQSMSVSTMRGRYSNSVSAFLCDSPQRRVSWGRVYSLVLEAPRQSILNFRIGFLSWIGPPFPILSVLEPPKRAGKVCCAKNVEKCFWHCLLVWPPLQILAMKVDFIFANSGWWKTFRKVPVKCC